MREAVKIIRVFDRPEAADCELCHAWVVFSFFHNTSSKLWPFMNRRRLFVDLLLRDFRVSSGYIYMSTYFELIKVHTAGDPADRYHPLR